MIQPDIEPKEFQRIEDLLEQIRKKYGNWHPKHEHNRELQNQALDYLNALLEINQRLGESNAVGWL
jgi:hypothetical protein